MYTEKLKDDISILFKNIDTRRLTSIFKNSLSQAIKTTTISKKKAIKSLFKTIVTGFFRSVKFVTSEGNDFIRNDEYLVEIPTRLRRYSLNKKKYAQRIYLEYKALNTKDKLNVIHDALIFFLFMSVSGGGRDFEGGLPDTDIKFGIGNHRNIFSHSILLPLSIEVATRFIVGVSSEYRENLLEFGHLGKFLIKIVDFVETNENLMIAGMWAGISMHLFKDVGVLQNVTKPYTGITGHSMAFHKGLFSTNAFLAFFFSKEALNNK